MNKEQYLTAMKATAIPAAWAGLWYVKKTSLSEATPGVRKDKLVMCPPGDYTLLYRITDETLLYNPPGEVVMEDTAFELQTHLGFVMHAQGRVLVTGLGLGCVVRGLLKNPQVEHVTVIENSKEVLRLVAPYMPVDRLTVVEADALEWTAKNDQAFDCGWHDVWTDRCNGEPHLDVWHIQMLINCKGTVKRQGAWGLHYIAKQVLVRRNFPWIG